MNDTILGHTFGEAITKAATHAQRASTWLNGVGPGAGAFPAIAAMAQAEAQASLAWSALAELIKGSDD